MKRELWPQYQIVILRTFILVCLGFTLPFIAVNPSALAQDGTQILQKLDAWMSNYSLEIQPLGEAEACKRLTQKGLTSKEIHEKLRQTSVDRPSVLADYVDLHGVHHLSMLDPTPDLTEDFGQQLSRSLFQMAEVILLNLESLYSRTAIDIRNNDLARAAEKQGWINSLNNSLIEISKHISKVVPDRKANMFIDVTQSPNFLIYRSKKENYLLAIQSRGLINSRDIGQNGISDYGRFISASALTNEASEQLWVEELSTQIRLDSPLKYRDFIGTKYVALAVREVTQNGDNFLTQFKAYHQISEIFVRFANFRLAKLIQKLVDKSTPLFEIDIELRHLSQALSVVESGLHPLLRNLSPTEYQKIRGSLGITSGSHSPNIKLGLFNSTYPLLVDAVLFRFGNSPDSLRNLIEGRNSSSEGHASFGILQSTYEIHKIIERWRSLHLHLVIDQLGLAPPGSQQTASISGAPSAYMSASRMRRMGNARAKITPICEALGQSCSSSQYHTQIKDSQFLQEMGAATAEMVRDKSRDVQDRVNNR